MKAIDKETGLTRGRLMELLEVYPESGHFVWKTWRGGTAHAGTLAGCANSSGYLLIKIDGHYYLNHRLMWLYVHGCWPENDLDHVNLDKLDNRIKNLREATRSQNVSNGRVRCDSESQRRGVRKIGNRFMARITKQGVREYLGCYGTAEEAHEQYALAAKRLHGEFARM